MKKFFIVLISLISFTTCFAQSKNPLLSRDFWKTNTTITAVKWEMDKGHSPSEFDAGAFDPISIAIMKGAPEETIKFLLKQEGNYVDKLTHDSRTYLHWAAMSGNASLVNYLIESGFDIHAKDSRGMTPLTFAAERGKPSTDVFEAFFKAGIDPKATYKNGENILHLIIPNDKDLIITNYLLSKGLSLKDTDQNGNTLFNYAAKKGDISLMKNLLSKGVKATNNALLFAAQGARNFSNKIEVYKYLVDELKMKTSITNKEGQNVLHFIVNNENSSEIVKFFLDKKVNINQVDTNGNTPFINAGKSKDITIIELLLPKVDNINRVNKLGESVLSNAVKYSLPEIVQLLLKNNANPQIKDINGNSLAYYWVESFRSQANEKQQKDFLQKQNILLENHIDFSALQAEGNLIHLAVLKNNLSLLQIISSLKIDVNARNKQGETPLIKAAMIAKDDAILKYLISMGADKNIKTEFGETAYDLATENEILEGENISVEFLK